MDNFIILDIETKPNLEFTKFIDKPEPPRNYIDPIKIENYIKAKTEDMIPKMSLDIDFCKIAAIGINQSFDNPEHFIYLCPNEKEEMKALEQFWEFALFSKIIGFNIKTFDLPIILRRSFMLGVTPSAIYRRYDDRIIDLMYLLYHDGYASCPQKFRGLKKICEILNINNPLLGVDGAQVINMSEKELQRYLANDLKLLQQLAKKMEGFYYNLNTLEGGKYVDINR